ncbi:DUF5605 domain-containing protein [Streptomyces arenae]|uniref:DUF5605 domain-containing protein n=1 Tax=Streptomyces arenae TaxID=29301 RepID=UPI0026580AD8|nr:DUF5605 domain-containing protein [Streptomyces arenae]MCG7210064.1 DUF5605 domain-containing protein [Streptomyces arenae]
MPWAQPADGTMRIGYFGFNRPRFRNLVLPKGEWTIDVLDTWNMTVERVPGTFCGTARTEFPGRQFMAVRLLRVAD